MAELASRAAISEPVIILESTRGEPLECECLRTGKAGKHRHARIADREIPEGDAGLAAHYKASDAAIYKGRAEAPSIRELFDQRLGNIFDRTVDQDLIVRCALAVACVECAFDRFDPGGASLLSETSRAFNRNNFQAYRVENGGGVSRAGTDHQSTLAREGHHLRQQLPDSARRGKEPAVSERYRTVGVSERPSLFRNETL